MMRCAKSMNGKSVPQDMAARYHRDSPFENYYYAGYKQRRSQHHHERR